MGNITGKASFDLTTTIASIMSKHDARLIKVSPKVITFDAVLEQQGNCIEVISENKFFEWRAVGEDELGLKVLLEGQFIPNAPGVLINALFDPFITSSVVADEKNVTIGGIVREMLICRELKGCRKLGQPYLVQIDVSELIDQAAELLD